MLWVCEVRGRERGAWDIIIFDIGQPDKVTIILGVTPFCNINEGNTGGSS